MSRRGRLGTPAPRPGGRLSQSAGNLLVTARYTHAHNGVIIRRDFDQMVELLVTMLQKLDAPTVAAIRDFTP